MIKLDIREEDYMKKKFVASPEQRKREGALLKAEFLRFLAHDGMTQAKLLADLRINPGNPSRWFRGTKQIPAHVLLTLADRMGFDAKAIRPQIEEEIQLWLTTQDPVLSTQLQERYEALDERGRELLLRNLEAIEALQGSRQ